MTAEQLFQKIQERFPKTEVLKSDPPTIRVPADAVLDVCRFLRFELKFDYLSFVTAVDWKSQVGEESFTHDDPWALAGVVTQSSAEAEAGPMPIAKRGEAAPGLYRDAFEIIYHLYSYETGAKLFLKTEIPRENPQVDSVATLWPTANWHERETYDFFGIKFLGHPDLRRILLPWEWDKDEGKWPLRKDYVHKRDQYD